MYVYPKTADRRPRREKPSILFVLQGAHHLMLYENVFRYCTQFNWYCVLPAIPKDTGEMRRFHASYGVRFFTDGLAALAHFPQIDAVITTWAVPHRKHLPYIRYISLAYEIGIPVFEFQHGLFQIGVTYSEDAALVGSRSGAAAALPDANNLSSEILLWSGSQGVGYPRAMIDSDDDDTEEAALRRQRVTIITNHHWSILEEAERANCYAMIYDAVRAFPTVEFVLLPHGGEVGHAAFRDMVERLNALEAGNFAIETGRDDGFYDRLLRNSDLIVGSVSTTLLDCELSGTPAVVFRNPSQDGLTGTFQSAVLVGSSETLIGIINDVLYNNYRPELITGSALPFSPAVLADRVESAIRQSAPFSRQQIVVAVARYLTKWEETAEPA